MDDILNSMSEGLDESSSSLPDDGMSNDLFDNPALSEGNTSNCDTETVFSQGDPLNLDHIINQDQMEIDEDFLNSEDVLKSSVI